MTKRIVLSAVATLFATMTCAEHSYGMLALSQGKTSCKPTAPRGTSLYQYQLQCDPTAVESYQISMSYPGPNIDFIDSIIGLNGYVVDAVDGNRDIQGEINTLNGTGIIGGAIPATAPPTFTFNVSGHFPSFNVNGVPQSPPTGENNVFGVNFDQNPNTSADLPVTFSFFAQGTDFITGMDTDTGGTFTDDAAHIDPSFATTTANLVHAPEPTSIAVLGIATLGMLSRRRRA
jgi:hypothetical protein